MLDQEASTQQLALLATHRRTLAHLVQQAAHFSAGYIPAHIANGIDEARQQIRRIKAVLRKNGAQVEDDPNDKAPRRRKPAQAQRAGDVVNGDKVTGDKVMGDKRSINTERGDYAEGNIDKRQGAFVSGGTVRGNVVGTNLGTVTANYYSQQAASLTPALHQLRAPVSDFVGREHEIDQLVEALSKAASRGAAAISGVRGMGGIGKTELAHVLAHRLKDIFPDAHLLVELRGASSSPLTPEQALQTVIRAFEREAKLPDDLGQLQGIYRSLLTGKRVLILADDAKDAAQVRPLLPPPGCALLVTSRNRFRLPGMQTVDLEVLLPADAEKLLLDICSRIRKRAGELAQLCGYLPLALRVSASLLKENDSRGVALYVEQLRAERLKLLTDPDNPDDPQTSVEASLRLSYDALEPVAQSILCQLSAYPFDFSLKIAQFIINIGGEVAYILELLCRRSLLEWNASRRVYTFHDLVRSFAYARIDNPEEMILRAFNLITKQYHKHNDAYLGLLAMAKTLISDFAVPPDDQIFIRLRELMATQKTLTFGDLVNWVNIEISRLEYSAIESAKKQRSG